MEDKRTLPCYRRLKRNDNQMQLWEPGADPGHDKDIRRVMGEI